MAQYVKAFQDRVADCPSYLRRHMALIKDLDEQVTRLQKELEHHSRRQVLKVMKPEHSEEGHASKRVKHEAAGAEEEADYDVGTKVTKLLGLAEEKVSQWATAFPHN